MAGTPPLTYDPAANQATLTDHGDVGWYLWLHRPVSDPGTPHLFSEDEVGGEIDRLSDQKEVISFFERLLIEAGYRVATDELPLEPSYIAAWALTPGQN